MSCSIGRPRLVPKMHTTHDTPTSMDNTQFGWVCSTRGNELPKGMGKELERYGNVVVGRVLGCAAPFVSLCILVLQVLLRAGRVKVGKQSIDQRESKCQIKWLGTSRRDASVLNGLGDVL